MRLDRLAHHCGKSLTCGFGETALEDRVTETKMQRLSVEFGVLGKGGRVSAGNDQLSKPHCGLHCLGTAAVQMR
jgi:hypothetical protein